MARESTSLVLPSSGKSPNGEPRETRQITYITDNSDKLFLSREACIALGIITTRFPTVGEVMSPSCPQISCAGSSDETDIDTHRCGCPRRQKPPPVPTKLPFAAHGKTDKNCMNIYWTTTHRARSTPANISCYP